MVPRIESHDYAGRSLSGSSLRTTHAHSLVDACSHLVQFYEDDAVFLNGLSDSVGSMLGGGGSCIVIATKAHREGLDERLRACGIDISFAAEDNRYICLDAEGTLAGFMVDGRPDKERFYSAIEPVLLRANVGARDKASSIVTFGEMVALLSADGKYDAAIRLEKLWNGLTRKHSFTLRCAYPMDCFEQEEQAHCFSEICAEHSGVIPAESYTSLQSEDDRLRMVSVLQQKAHTLRVAVEEREREIAHRKSVEERLQRSEEFARKVVESSLDCVKILGLDGRLEYMSLPGQRALEIEDESEFIGRRWIDLWKEEDQPRAEAALREAQSGRVGSFQGDCLTFRGVLKSWDVQITPALDGSGAIERLIAVSRESTELKRAQAAIIQAEKLAATGRLAATIAHEINNPLEAVTNFIYLAKTTEGVPEDVCQYLEVADRELARVVQIAQQTLGFYRDNSKQRWVNVSESIRSVILLYERKLQYKRLEIQVDADTELEVHTKQGELRQALSNLIVNAIDASNEGGKLWMRAQPTRNWTNGLEEGVRITLADNGCGMPPEVQQRIFMPFFTTKANVGTGLGLWITKSLIEGQGGYLRFRSRQGKNAGTVMSVFLPLSHDERADVKA